MFRTRRYWVMCLMQSVAVYSALLLAWLLRYDFMRPRPELLLVAGPALVAIQWICMSWCKLTHGYWRYTGIGDLKDLLWAVVTGTLAFFAVMRIICASMLLPMSVYAIEGVLTFLLLAGLRVNARMILQARDARLHGAKSPVLIVGAGSAAVQLLHALKGTGYRAVGLVDDDMSKHKLKLGGVPVLGRIDELPVLAHRYEVSEILIAIPSATGAEMIHITDVCKRRPAVSRSAQPLRSGRRKGDNFGVSQRESRRSAGARASAIGIGRRSREAHRAGRHGNWSGRLNRL